VIFNPFRETHFYEFVVGAFVFVIGLALISVLVALVAAL